GQPSYHAGWRLDRSHRWPVHRGPARTLPCDAESPRRQHCYAHRLPRQETDGCESSSGRGARHGLGVFQMCRAAGWSRHLCLRWSTVVSASATEVIGPEVEDGQELVRRIVSVPLIPKVYLSG